MVDGRARKVRADALRNSDALIAAAKEEFAIHGVDAPAKAIADRAGVGVGTLYRRFPKRSDLVMAVLSHDVDACIEEARLLRISTDPVDALVRWVARYTDFVATKRGLGAALHVGDPAFEGLGSQLIAKLEPSAAELLVDASAAGFIRSAVNANELLRAIAYLCVPGPDDAESSRRMVGLLMDGLRVIPSSG
jgi:AcrR family transcriptional regulator